jgi:bacterioferritin
VGRSGGAVQGSEAVVELLNEVLTAELTAVNQYFVHAKMLENWGYHRLAHHARDESIGEMKDADHLIERILYLEGTPNLQRLGTVSVGETVPEQLGLDLELERVAIERLNRGIALCVAEGDNGSREVLDDILEGEEDHADWLESQLELIRQVGEAHYLAQQIHD